MSGFPKIIVKRNLNSDAYEAFKKYAIKDETEEERKKRELELKAKSFSLRKLADLNQSKE